MMCGIYYIVNRIDGKIYVGSSNNTDVRFYKHRWKLKKGIHENPYLQNAWNKHGEENFEFKVIETCFEPFLLLIEQFYLTNASVEPQKYYNFNFLSSKPPSPRGRRLSKKTKKLLSRLRTGNKNPSYGKKLSSETKKKMSDSKSKIHRFISTSGEVVSIRNLKSFCRENKLNEGGMYGVNKGRYRQYKGWRKYIN